ncbi:unnamed protein product [Enterobius vermicularis]|uniref:Transthyretin-like family protein n=1 Tax=Enterobius vermicularis TaxID=51028 RepID=A0A0N4VHP8_ENTVE|nr:unnamed protein product [Enterobius vermicularis]
MVLLRCCLAAILIIQVVFGLGSYKSVTVKGQVGCGDYEVSNVTVELWEKDRADPDDLLNTTTTDKHGKFSVYGGENEIGNIEPYLRIIHSCENGKINPKCTIKDNYKIPKQYVNGVYDMGIVSLNVVRDEHKKKCVD